MKDYSQYKFASIKMVSVDEKGVVSETTTNCLIKSTNNSSVTFVGATGKIRTVDLFDGLLTLEPRIKTIEYLDDESDEYQEFICAINATQVSDQLQQLAQQINDQFEQMIQFTPTTKQTLMQMLSLSVKNLDQQND